MIIGSPNIKSNQMGTCISARIQSDRPFQNISSTLWFRFPVSYTDSLSHRSDGFVVSLLLLAMLRCENIYVEGAMSFELFTKLKRYQRVFNSWFPKDLKLIDVQCDNLIKTTKADNKKKASAFSGGVDSFYTLLSHLPENDKKKNSHISYVLFVHGFDIPLKDRDTYNAVEKEYRQLLDKKDVHLISIATNAKEMTYGLNWEIAHGPVLIGMGLFFQNIFSHFYIPSGDPYYDLIPWGSHPEADPILSTGQMKIIHDGASFSRIQKVLALAKWPLTYSALRVCWKNPNGLTNCCKCEKCIRTMLMLKMHNCLDKYQTFPIKLKVGYIRKCRTPYEQEYNQLIEIKKIAIKNNEKIILFNLNYALFKNRLLNIIGRYNPFKTRRAFSRLKLLKLKQMEVKQYIGIKIQETISNYQKYG